MLVRRRDLLTGSSALLLSSPVHVNAARLKQNLEALSRYGRPPGGVFTDGVSRVGYSDADIAGRAFVIRLIEQTGVRPRIDEAGNIFARRAGSGSDAAPVLFGSHIDSVPNGGNFDGDLGALAAIEILHVVNEHKLTTRRPLEIVVWACEEATFNGMSLNGSRARSLTVAARKRFLSRAREQAEVSRSAASRASSLSIAITSRSKASPTTPARRRWRTGRMR
ncbi:MAG: M20/M25/M40 family metallo-hydrolase [Acidobacteria bacterium]|nr:M20/M25/M40 family metallo-hydrolase [Acidobacteriota bacterium]